MVARVAAFICPWTTAGLLMQCQTWVENPDEYLKSVKALRDFFNTVGADCRLHDTGDVTLKLETFCYENIDGFKKMFDGEWHFEKEGDGLRIKPPARSDYKEPNLSHIQKTFVMNRCYASEDWSEAIVVVGVPYGWFTIDSDRKLVECQRCGFFAPGKVHCIGLQPGEYKLDGDSIKGVRPNNTYCPYGLPQAIPEVESKAREKLGQIEDWTNGKDLVMRILKVLCFLRITQYEMPMPQAHGIEKLRQMFSRKKLSLKSRFVTFSSALHLLWKFFYPQLKAYSKVLCGFGAWGVYSMYPAKVKMFFQILIYVIQVSIIGVNSALILVGLVIWLGGPICEKSKSK